MLCATGAARALEHACMAPCGVCFCVQCLAACSICPCGVFVSVRYLLACTAEHIQKSSYSRARLFPCDIRLRVLWSYVCFRVRNVLPCFRGRMRYVLPWSYACFRVAVFLCAVCATRAQTVFFARYTPSHLVLVHCVLRERRPCGVVCCVLPCVVVYGMCYYGVFYSMCYAHRIVYSHRVAYCPQCGLILLAYHVVLPTL